MTEKQNNPIGELQKFQERANQQPGTFLKNNECTGHLSNTKRPASPQKMTNVCDDRIKTNNFTTSKEDKNTLREIGVSLSVSTMEASA